MKFFEDFRGQRIRLTEERLKHILGHPEMTEIAHNIGRTLLRPEKVVQSLSDSEAQLYYRFYLGTRVGDKYLCVVVKVKEGDAFVLTAYLTDSIKKGEILWPKK